MNIFLLTLLFMGSASALVHDGAKKVSEITCPYLSCREFVAEASDNHPLVLGQFDHFTKKLREAYFDGEGLIEKDLYRILDAITFSADKHRFQTRKDPFKTPYIIHTIGVSDILLNIGKVRDPDILIGALLHDTVEDTLTTFEEIEERFGVRVAQFVREVTDDKTLPKHIRKELQVVNAPKKSAGAAQIKLADKLYNLQDLSNAPPSDWSKERVDAYFSWAESVIEKLPWVNGPLKAAVDKEIRAHK